MFKVNVLAARRLGGGVFAVFFALLLVGCNSTLATQVKSATSTATSAVASASASAASSAAEAEPEIMQAESMLFLRGDEQIAAFRDVDAAQGARLIPGSAQPMSLPTAATQLAGVKLPAAATGDKQVSLDEFLTQNRIAGMLVIKDGEVVLEEYRLGNTAESRWISFSVAKSVVAMLIGAAIEDGYINSVDEKVTDYLPRLKSSAYDQTTIRNLLQMASGVEWNEDYADPNSDVGRADYATLALYEHLRNKPRTGAPGDVFNYNTAETNLAGTLLRSAMGNNLSTYLNDKIWQPFGMADDAYWQLTEIGGGEFGGCCINATLRDYARIGMFAMADGVLPDGTRVLPAGWMKASTAPSKGYDGYGYFWWLNPDDTYSAMGVFGQAIYVNAEANVVIAMHSAWDVADAEERWDLYRRAQDVLAKQAAALGK